MKIFTTLFWFMVGGTVGIVLINLGVIGAKSGNVVSSAGLAVYNLHDHVIPFLIFFVAGTVLSLTAILVIKMVQKSTK